MTAPRTAATRGAPLWARVFWKAHTALYRATDGVIGHSLVIQRTLLLTTTGRKSGEPRTRAITYFSFPNLDGALALVASNWGSDAQPAWYFNLLVHPEAQVQLKRERFPVVARVASPEERARLWPQVVAANRQYARYQAGTSREIPIVLLRRAS
ncbi:MAG TPA: nitroreductase family deazaflavin-dependent oxidoreductase [Ktedonobacterales bacterium]